MATDVKGFIFPLLAHALLAREMWLILLKMLSFEKGVSALGHGSPA